MRQTIRIAQLVRVCLLGIWWVPALLGLIPCSWGQNAAVERRFTQSKVVVEKALKDLRPALAGRLPVLDGFADPGSRPLDRFQRGYYQCEVAVSSTTSGGSLVKVSAKITAWYADPAPGKSGYQVLASNGRIENDLLDQLGDGLGAKGTAPAASASPTSAFPTAASRPGGKSEETGPKISAPLPNSSVLADAIASSKTPATAAVSAPKSGEDVASLQTQRAVASKHVEELTTEARNLEEILRTQAHPNNLAAVKKSGTPVLASPNEGAQVLFAATAQDEFEILDINASWVHVRMSGLSRGWILRSNLELPDSTPAAPAAKQEPASPAQAVPFQVSGEQIASFPGSWAALQGKTVKIISVEETADKSANTGSHAKLEFAKSVLGKEYAELAHDSGGAAGIVLIFDAEDGGMMAATLPVLQQWKAGNLSDEALWRRCFFDPPEMSGQAANP
jgi:hypothetical protein